MTHRRTETNQTAETVVLIDLEFEKVLEFYTYENGLFLFSVCPGVSIVGYRFRSRRFTAYL